MGSVERWLGLRSELEGLGVELLVVTKNCTVDAIGQLFKMGQLDFGESRVRELCEKAAQLDSTVKWHFIGHLQTNKCAKLLQIPNLHMIQSVDSMELFNKLSQLTTKLNRQINVLIQVNTTLKPTQYGIDYRNITLIISLVRSVMRSERVKFRGLMTIGDGTKDSFHRLNGVKKRLEEEFGELGEFVMSMGMSSDYKLAIQMGSNHIRIGTLIFNS
ncbi:proline synthase co-transcribed-like protein [Theileria parva strain Muguga]|uniref:Pyridoxal phosphate homeostasis protein n=1 Tax=Theileria parva TaxID=5875 RepID=Q4N4S5_THEPA|nr:proline synthase co-transcribed-like protein [Theileria parva strain Muguga]EAN32848.1 proline synthase co-transcribed-like protein [Theileria parva strain Muguga]|eukprot:XP_765131.1 hypothetical protein [Theileria parva strain Muguga]